jgi:hypothetical protein
MLLHNLYITFRIEKNIISQKKSGCFKQSSFFDERENGFSTLITLEMGKILSQAEVG